MFSSGDEDVTPVVMERRSSYSGARNGLLSQSFNMTETARNSLTNIPVYNVSQSEAAKHHGHSNSDSGRSSSSKSTGSVGGRCQPLSDMGSGGPSPPPIEVYEMIVRDLEEKLRERDLELQRLGENLDENEAAICQVSETFIHTHIRSDQTCRVNVGLCLTAGVRGETETQRAGDGGVQADVCG